MIENIGQTGNVLSMFNRCGYHSGWCCHLAMILTEQNLLTSLSLDVFITSRIVLITWRTGLSEIMGFSYPIRPVSYTLSTPFTQCPIPLSFTPLLNFLFKPLSSSPPSWVVDWFWWLVWLSGFLSLCCGFSCFVVWSVLFFLLFLLPHSPSVPSTFFYPSLKITYQT